jgi:SAM-dependent methyltransferase
MRSSRGKKINAVSIPGFKGETSVYQNYFYYEQNRVFRTFVPNEIKVNCTCSGAHDWTNKLYFEHPEIILPILESRKEKALRDVEGLCRLFAKFGVPREGKILDLSCGIGRHSVPLSQVGYQVVGYDLSPLFIERAKELAKQKDGGSKLNKIRFYQGDSRHAARMLSGKGESEFDVI